MERARGNEQDMVGAHHAITRIHGRAFNDRQNVPLHALTRDIRSVAAFASSNFIDLVKENDARIFHAVNGHAGNLVHINETLLFFLDQVLERFVDLHLSLFGALTEDVGQHVLDVDIHLFDTLIRDDLE